MKPGNDALDLISTLTGTVGTPRACSHGVTLFRRGNIVRHLFVVVDGEVRLVRHPELGQAVILQAARHGDIVAEASIFAQEYHCDAVTVTGVNFVRFDSEEVRRGMLADPESGAALVRRFANEIQRLRSRAALLTIRSAEQRVVAYLESIAVPDEKFVDPGCSWKDVATEIGLTFETVYRTLSKLERQGRFERKGPAVRVIVPTA